MIHRVSENLQRIRSSIEAVIVQHALSQPVTLVAVSKLQPVESIQAAYEAGQRDFGENYIDELLSKARSLPKDIKWHMIGHVQSNKVAKLLSIENLSAIHTVDSLSLALKLDKKLQEMNKNLEFFLQINTSEEISKSGLHSSNFFDVLEEILKKCQNLKFKGFMTIGEKGSFEDFQLLRKCRMETAEKTGLDELQLMLSMGMSADYEQALQYGSNFIRTSASFRADYMIQQRRAKEGQMLGLHSYIQDDHRLRHKAEWESKSDNLVTQASVSKRFQELRAVHSQHLDARRQKLAELLRQEEEQYRQEYINKQETPEDIRRKMAERLEFLKNSRENERQQEVAFKLEQRWRDSADDLRTQEGKLAAMHCRLHQETQMWEKMKQEEENREEEKIFNELWIEDKRKKDQQELERLAQKEKLNSDRLQYLNWQRQLRENQRRTLNEREQVEKQMLNEEWEAEKIKEQALKRERDRLLKERNLEIIQHNELTKQLKVEEEKRERDLDRQLIDAIVRKEEYEERLELEEKVKRRLEAKEMIKHYNLRARQEGDMEKMIEEYAKAENDEQWRRLDQKWDMEEKARILLMTEVYESRAREIQDRRKREADEKEKDRLEKERIQREVAQAEELDRMRKTAIRDVKVQNQDHLRWQIEEKNIRQQKSLQEEMLEKRAAKMAEIQYQRKIEEERKKGMEILDALRAKRPY